MNLFLFNNVVKLLMLLFLQTQHGSAGKPTQFETR